MNALHDDGPLLSVAGHCVDGALSPPTPIDLGPSRSARALREQLDRAAAASRVLVVGPPGSGHAAAALALHRLGPRAGGPLIRVFAGDEDLSPLGQDSARSGGTLFVARVELLDPVGQGLLAATLESGQGPAGLIATSEVDLLGLGRPEGFDEELAYALNVATVSLPALGDRAEDLPDLARAAAAELARRRGRDLELTPAALECLAARTWQGNLEELELVLARAVLVAQGHRIEAADLGLAAERPDALPLGDRRLASLERALIERVLEEAEGNRSLAARQLGVNRSTLYNKLRAWGLH